MCDTKGVEMVGREKIRRRPQMDVIRAPRSTIRPGLHATTLGRAILLQQRENETVSGERGSDDVLRAHDRPRLHEKGRVQQQLLQRLAQVHDARGEGEDQGPQEVRLHAGLRVLQEEERGAQGYEQGGEEGAQGRGRSDQEGLWLLFVGWT